MANSKTERLIKAAAQLSNVASKEWEELLAALADYSVDLNRRMLAAESGMLANAQGQAVQADYIFNLLSDARRTTQTAEIRRNARPNNERKSWPSS